MRIDGFTSSYSPDRSARSGSAVTPFREAQREIEERREQPASPASTQGFEPVAQTRKVEAGNASSDSLPSRLQDQLYQPPLNNRAAQALASYSSTASFASEADAQQVMGLDLYA
ncbi:conserved hypothetical protein [Pseudomonas sp. 9AZ]|uniref:hypothetical protein n=1 Tax=Pseudomonas sp. 9AZ TaxID=2653168 RepID=UPI0012EF5B0A|nr:hypothetical protein [Pseudomonas sp. 9AZ]VXC37221.1 conserved hypothetical protein [Pseudomonas sp. 9AZ]